MDDDPDYILFLQNLRVHGHSYALQGFSHPVLRIYEEEIDLNRQKDAFFEREGGSDSVIAQLVNQEETDSSEVSENTSKLKKGENSQVKPLKHEPFDWIEEIREPSFTKCSEFTNFSDSDEEIKYEIPIEILNRPESEYKDKLIKYLSSPFNKKEYKVLMKRAARRSKKILSKETRRGVRACETDQLSKSYFDWYPDFARQVEKAGKDRQWFLLRGFFFWLQNVGCEGSFKPWVEKGKKDRKSGSAS